MTRYDAFLSYAHHDEKDVEALQRRIERFAVPWWRRRKVHLFRDEERMTANADLWESIRDAMRHSDRLVLMASPAAAASPGVRAELEWWLQHRKETKPLLVLVDGELEWTDGGWSAKSTAVPSVLGAAFTEEPKWIDARPLVRSNAARAERVDILAGATAAVRGVKPIDVHDEFGRYSKRMRWLTSAAAGVGVLLVAALLIASQIVAGQNTVSSANALAAASAGLLATDFPRAQLLAVEAYRLDRNPRTTEALFRAVTAEPELMGYMDAGSEVTALAAAAHADVIVAGTATGDVVRWSDGRRAVATRMAGAVRHVAVSDDGRTAVAAGESDARLLIDGASPKAVEIADGRKPTAVGVSPSGRRAVVSSATTFDIDSEPIGDMMAIDTTTSPVTAVRTPLAGTWFGMSVQSDSEVTLYSGDGSWVQRDVADPAVRLAGEVGLGFQNQAATLSADGRFLAAATASGDIPIWETARGGSARYEDPQRSASVPGSRREALAISPSGGRIAVADSGRVSVAAVTEPNSAAQPQWTFAGNRMVSALMFMGDDRVVAAAGTQVATWDLDRGNRIAADLPAAGKMSSPCTACPGLQVTFSPDGKSAAVTGGDPYALLLRTGSHETGQTLLTTPDFDGDYASGVWTADGSLVVFPIFGDYARSEAEVRDGRTFAFIGNWPLSPGTRGAVATTEGPDGQVYDLSYSAGIRTRDARTGAVVDSRAIDDTVSGTWSAAKVAPPAAVDVHGRRASALGDDQIHVVDLESGSTTALGGDAESVVLGAHTTVLRGSDGSFDVRDDGGDSQVEFQLGSAQENLSAPATNGVVIAQATTDSRVVLLDARTGIEIGSIAVPTSAENRKTGIGFSPDGHTMLLAAPGRPGWLQQWTMDPEAWVSIACRTAGRDLSPAEWPSAAVSEPPADLRCGR